MHKILSKLTHVDIDILTELELWLTACETYYDIEKEDIMSDEDFNILNNKLLSYEIVEITEILTKKIQTTDGMVNVEQVKTEMVSLVKIDFDPSKKILSYKDLCHFFTEDIIQNPSKKYYIGPKYDGHATKVSLKNNRLDFIHTRGGQDITKHFIGTQTLTNLLSFLTGFKYPVDNAIYHCELVLPKEIYNKKYSTKYKNPRNAVSGVLKLNVEDLVIMPLTDGFNPLVNLPYWKEFNSEWFGKFEETFGTLDKIYIKDIKKDSFPFRVDGYVIGYETDNYQIKDNYPLNMASIKFDAITAQTKVIGMEWSQKKTTKLTPVYLLEPVMLDGSEVTRASGYNYDIVRKMKCGIGSIVEITKSNDIIPVVKRTITKSKDFVMPSVPYKIDGKNLVALDSAVSDEYKFVLAVKLLKLEGIGDTIANQLGEVVGYDIVKLFDKQYKPQIMDAIGNGKVFEKFNQIYQIRNIALDLMIELIQFDGVGKVGANKFACLLTGTKVDTNSLSRDVINYVLRGEGKQIIQDTMNDFKSLGIKIIKPVAQDGTEIMFEMSNNPPTGITKDMFVSIVKQKYPNAIHSTLTKNTKVLFVDSLDATSSKSNKARKYNITIITYSEFLSKGLPQHLLEN